MALSYIYMKRNDTLPDPTVILKDGDGNAVDISTADSVKFIMKSSKSDSAKVSHDAIIVDAAAGKVKPNWQSGDTDEAGKYDAEFQVTYIGGKIQTFPNTLDNRLIVMIIEDLGD